MEFVIWIIAILFGLFVGMVIGLFVGMERMRKAIEINSVGHLRIDRSEPEEAPRPFLELKGVTIESVAKEKFVVLKVVNENYLKD